MSAGDTVKTIRKQRGAQVLCVLPMKSSQTSQSPFVPCSSERAFRFHQFVDVFSSFFVDVACYNLL